MTQHKHAITPPPELVEKWSNLPLIKQEIIAIAWRNGADAELEACIEELYRLWDKDHIVTLDDVVKHLRAARRPKPPSLKEQALETLHSMRIAPVVINGINVNADVMNKYEIIRRALESLPS